MSATSVMLGLGNSLLLKFFSWHSLSQHTDLQEHFNALMILLMASPIDVIIEDFVILNTQKIKMRHLISLGLKLNLTFVEILRVASFDLLVPLKGLPLS